VIDRHTPLKKKVVRGITVSWVTPKIIQDTNTRNRLHRKFTENKTSENWETYRKQRNFVTSSKRPLSSHTALTLLQTLDTLRNFGRNLIVNFQAS